MSEKKEGLKLYGAPWYITLIGCAIVIAATYLGALGKDFASIMILIIAYGVVFFEIGERLPIWNTYIGGGVLAAFFGTAIIRQLSLIPKVYIDPINEFIGGDTVGFTTIWIIVLITGSVLSLEKKNLIKIICRLFPSNPWWIDRGNGIWCPCRIILWNFTSECNSSICTSCYGRWKWSRSSSDVRDL